MLDRTHTHVIHKYLIFPSKNKIHMKILYLHLITIRSLLNIHKKNIE